MWLKPLAIIPRQPMHVGGGITGACSDATNPGVEWQIPARLDGDSWPKQVPLDLLIKMLPSIHNESARIVGTLFCAETTNFAS